MDRTIFNFPESVRNIFKFLEEFYMREKISDPTFVRYESNEVFINIFHGRKYYEIGAEIGLLNKAIDEAIDEAPYSLSALIRCSNTQVAESYRNFTAKKPGSVIAGLEILREKILTYARDALLGDKVFFEKLKILRVQAGEALALETRASHERPKAEAAFRAKKYKEAIPLYESIYSSLTPAELKKLEYAKKQM